MTSFYCFAKTDVVSCCIKLLICLPYKTQNVKLFSHPTFKLASVKNEVVVKKIFPNTLIVILIISSHKFKGEQYI